MDEILRKYKDFHDTYARAASILLWAGLGATLLGIVLSVVFFIVNGSLENPIGILPFLPFLLLVFPGFAAIGISGTYRGKWNKLYKEDIFPSFLEATYPGVQYLPRSGLGLDDLMHPKFFAKPDRWSTCNFMHYKIDTTEFAMSDYTLEHEHRDKDGHVTYDVYAKGRFYVFTFPRVFRNNVKVMERTSKWGRQFNGMQVVELESVEFNKKFITYAEDQLAAFYILTPQVQEQMMNLERQFSGQIYYLFDDNHLYIAVNDSKDSFKFPLTRKFNEETLNDAMAEILIPKRFIEALKLNADKYKEEVLDHTI